MQDQQLKAKPLIAVDLGLIDYRQALALQRELHDMAIRNGDSFLLALEHPTVITLGKHSDPRHIAHDHNFDVVHTERGGEVTAHEPGQFVAYPILNLTALGIGPKAYIEMLERSLLELLSAYGIVGTTDSAYPGVWVGSAKVAAVGVRILKRVSFHGLALNVNNSLEVFRKITPCGISDRSVTTMAKIKGREFPISEIKTKFCNVFAAELERPWNWWRKTETLLPSHLEDHIMSHQ